MALPKVFIVIAKCSYSKQSFGIRCEQKHLNQWIADWAFAINEAAAMREGYDRSEITGSFGTDQAYPGCPFCKALYYFKCGCGKVACWDGESHTVTCPWCGESGELEGEIENLSVDKDL